MECVGWDHCSLDYCYTEPVWGMPHDYHALATREAFVDLAGGRAKMKKTGQAASGMKSRRDTRIESPAIAAAAAAAGGAQRSTTSRRRNGG